MKFFTFFIFLTILSFASCKQESIDDSKNSLSATVQYLNPGPCCSNMELANLEAVFSDLAGYSETILAAINIDEFDALDLENNDFIKIEFNFSSEEFLPCDYACNRHHGIPIELISIEKI